MAFDFNSIKTSSKEDLFILAKLLDPNVEKITEYNSFKIEYGYPVRGHLPADLIFCCEINYDGGMYTTPLFKVIVRECVQVHPSLVAVKLKTAYNGNVLLVNRFEPQLETKKVRDFFQKENVKIVWWSELL
jgi:hypothetical protein